VKKEWQEFRFRDDRSLHCHIRAFVRMCSMAIKLATRTHASVVTCIWATIHSLSFCDSLSQYCDFVGGGFTTCLPGIALSMKIHMLSCRYGLITQNCHIIQIQHIL